MAPYHALVFGASGIQGWAITNQILKEYPNPDMFARVTALTNRHLPLEDTLWPQTGKLHLVHGIDLLTEDGQVGLERRMAEIYDIESVSHVFFCAYVYGKDPKEECRINKKLLTRAINAVQHLSDNLEFVVLPSGTKAYGVHMMDAFPFKDQLPLKETYPRIPEPHASVNFYYHQEDALKELSAGESWSYCILRPDVLVGFVPNNNAYCVAFQFAVHLSIYRELHGEGAACPWPGSEETYNALSNDSSQDTIARFALYAALNPHVCGNGQIFNVPDSSQPTNWAERWPIVCDYFGLEGVPASIATGQEWWDFSTKNVEAWQALVEKYKLKEDGRSLGGINSAVVEGTIKHMDFDRHVDATKMLATGFRQRQNQSVRSTWYRAFDRFKQARMIP